MMNLLLLSAVINNPLTVIPTPTHVSMGTGSFELNAKTVVVADGLTEVVAKQLRAYLQPATGFELKSKRTAKSNRIAFFTTHDPQLGLEGYRLKVDHEGVGIWANSASGHFYAVQTLRQLLPVEVFGARRTKQPWTIPAVEIVDKPRFLWRGLMLDVGRHFFPKKEVLKFIDALAMHKMNHLHLHLTEDQGWRIEIKKYPKLTSIGSMRKETMAGHYSDHRHDGTPHGGFYTQKDIREMVAYAEKNHITIMPEIEMPGHCQSALAAYPDLGNTGAQLPVRVDWGVNENVYNVDDSTISFLKDVLTEVMALFPSQFIHIGGDEVPKKQWKESPHVQDLMRQRGLKTEEELQSWFIRQMDAFLSSHGRRLVGWDEILEGGLAPSATVMSWRGTKGGIAAAKAGHDVVMAPTTYTYFDFYQSKSIATEPTAIGGFLPLETVYAYDPVPAELNAAQAKHILGAQGQLWSEYIPTTDHLEFMAFPRTCALADAVWRAPGSTNFKGFRDRLTTHLMRLKAMGVNYRNPTIGSQAAVGTWRSGQISEHWTPHVWDLTSSFNKAGNYALTFQYTSGEHRLDIDGIEIEADGVIVATDGHRGRTGGEDVQNVYRVRLAKAYKKVLIRAKVRADGGSDSNGELYVVRER